MAIKVFLSHQKADGEMAARIAGRLQYHNIPSYLDIIDPYLGRPGEELAKHIRDEMGKCTQLLAVVSYATRESQWVPWEIGVAAPPAGSSASLRHKLCFRHALTLRQLTPL